MHCQPTQEDCQDQQFHVVISWFKPNDGHDDDDDDDDFDCNDVNKDKAKDALSLKMRKTKLFR